MQKVLHYTNCKHSKKTILLRLRENWGNFEIKSFLTKHEEVARKTLSFRNIVISKVQNFQNWEWTKSTWQSIQTIHSKQHKQYVNRNEIFITHTHTHKKKIIYEILFSTDTSLFINYAVFRSVKNAGLSFGQELLKKSLNKFTPPLNSAGGRGHLPIIFQGAPGWPTRRHNCKKGVV